MALLLTDDDEIRGLNAEFRGFDEPTDVLAFPVGGPCAEAHLGDVVVSVERAAAQAGSRGVSLDAELELLVVHGTLHLLGYDHDEAEAARRMRARTRAIRRVLRPLRP